VTIQPPFPAGDALSETAPPPDGRPLMTVSSYADAVAAVDALADARFPVEHVAIVGRGVRTVEDVTGRSGPMREIAGAAATGGVIGLFFGLLFDWWGALTPEVGWGWLALYGLAYGAFAGLVVSLLLQSVRGRRDFASVRTLDADHYDVTLTGAERAQALRILHDARLV
jgi:hypothetical protein